VQATRPQTQKYTAVPSASGGYGSYGSNAVNTEGGASGSSSTSFNLSKGALIAIIVVVVSVAVFGSELPAHIRPIDQSTDMTQSHQ
jgi:hypothetical protein